MNIIKGIDFSFSDPTRLEVYKNEILKWAAKDYKLSIMQLGYGTSAHSTNLEIARYVKDSGMELGYYWFIYGYNGDSNFADTYYSQGVSFAKAVKNMEDNGFKTKCKLALDIEASGFVIKNSNQRIIDQMTPPSGEEMFNAVKSFIDGFETILKGREYIMYSSLSFSQENFDKRISTLCGSEWISTDEAGNPFTDQGPIQVQERIGGYTHALEWCDNKWCGWQYQEDLDDRLVDINGFNELIYSGKLQVEKPKFSKYNYVKLKSGTKFFAPTKIPNTDKNVKYQICKTQDGIYELNKINQWVTASELNLISQYVTPPKQPNSPKTYNTGGKRIPITGYENDYIADNPNGLFPGGNGYSNSLVEFVKKFEGLHLTPYHGEDKQNQTIGWGHAVPSGTYPENYRISIEEAEKLLTDDLNSAASDVIAAEQKYGVSFNQNQFDAMVAYVMNLGGSLENTPQGGPLEPGLEHSVFKYLKANGAQGDIYLRTCFTEFANYTGEDGQLHPSEGLYDRCFSEFWLFKYGVYDVIKGTPVDVIINSCPEFY